MSYNKLGDLEYGAGNVGAGLRWYQQGLAVREQALSSSQHAGPSEQLDVAVSIIKVADACQVMVAFVASILSAQPATVVQHDFSSCLTYWFLRELAHCYCHGCIAQPLGSFSWVTYLRSRKLHTAWLCSSTCTMAGVDLEKILHTENL